MNITITVQLSPWWVACLKDAIAGGMWAWAEWLADHPHVEIL